MDCLLTGWYNAFAIPHDSQSSTNGSPDGRTGAPNDKTVLPARVPIAELQQHNQDELHQ
jgi:hypothetical protein